MFGVDISYCHLKTFLAKLTKNYQAAYSLFSGYFWSSKKFQVTYCIGLACDAITCIFKFLLFDGSQLTDEHVKKYYKHFLAFTAIIFSYF